jgi:hypothetical protein
MRQKVVACAASVALALTLAACGSDTDEKGSAAPAGTSASPTPSPTPSIEEASPSSSPSETSTPSESPSTTTSPESGPPVPGGLTKPGAELKIGQPAVVEYEWIKKKLRFAITPRSITKGSISDLARFKLDARAKRSTPFYVRVAVRNMGPHNAEFTSVGSRLRGVDDREELQGQLILFGSFPKCESETAPRGFTTGKSYETCLVFMVGGTGEIVGLEWPHIDYRQDAIRWSR